MLIDYLQVFLLHPLKGGIALRVLLAEVGAGYLACLKDPAQPIAFDLRIYESVTVMEETGDAFLAMMRELLAAVPGAVEGMREEGGAGRSRKRGCVGGVGRV